MRRLMDPYLGHTRELWAASHRRWRLRPSGSTVLRKMTHCATVVSVSPMRNPYGTLPTAMQEVEAAVCTAGSGDCATVAMTPGSAAWHESLLSYTSL